MVLKTAFNLLTRFHSRAAVYKRPGSPNLFSPVRITPSNYFRFIAGPSQIVIRGREFVIPVDTLTGTVTQLISFEDVPTEGGFFLTYGSDTTSVLAFDALAADVQAALRALPGLEGVEVEGDFTDGFTVKFFGVNQPTLLTSSLDDPPLDTDITISVGASIPLSPLVKRGDRIVDSVLGTLTIDEIIELVDIGGAIMGFRCRTE